MPRLRRLKLHYLGLECLNALGVAFYYNYLFFYMRLRFDFSDRHNLVLSAFNGLLYTFAAWQAGRIAQRFGYLTALTGGLAIMAVALFMGLLLDQVNALPNLMVLQVAVMTLWTLGVASTWPALEALVSDRESPQDLPRVIGMYNVTWAGAWAVAYFTGGALLETLGGRSIFAGPLIIALVQLAWIRHLRRHPEIATIEPPPSPEPPTQSLKSHKIAPPPALAALYLRLAWIANPFSFMAISALVPLIPGLAERHHLTPTQAGVFCSVWFFARLAAFVLLWHWSAWHYRFHWLLGAFALLIASFAGILLAPGLWLLFLFQIFFGLATGLLYYSSLYYSMSASHDKGEHGGIHEAGIGAGIFAGPALGSLALYLFPHYPTADTWAVSIALGAGLLAVSWIYQTQSRRPPPE